MICEDLDDINEACEGNAGGLLKVIAQDESEVTVTYSADRYTVTGVTTAKRFVTIPMKRGRGGFTDTPTIDRNTGVSSFSGTLTARLPRRRQEVVTAIKKLGAGQRDLTIAYQDGNKKYWLIPSGWLSSAVSNTGEGIADPNNEEIQFMTEGEWIERGYEISEAQFLGLMEAIEPEITSFEPTSGAIGDVVSIIGVGFTGTTSIDFGGEDAPVFTVVTDNVINVTIPAGLDAGPTSVTVTNAGGTSENAAFTITE